jgi:hypothetical protein
MPRVFGPVRRPAPVLVLLAGAAAAVSFIVAPQLPAVAAARAAGTGFGPAIEIRPPANTATAVDASLAAVACSGHGYCSAGGSYADTAGNTRAMVVSEARGRWARGVELKLPANAAANPGAQVSAIACTSPGNCVGVGYYEPKPGNNGDWGFIVTQRRGDWGRAVAAAPLPSGAVSSALSAVACPAPGSCAAAGFAITNSGFEGLVLAQSRGRWKTTILHGPRGEGPELAGIACTKPGDCVAAGYYFPTSLQTFSRPVGYVESRGRWGRVVTVKSPKNLNGDLSGFLGGACAPGGSCLAVGSYEAGAHDYSMAAPESGGRWKPAAEIGARPARASDASIYGVSCASSRLCVAAGSYSTTGANLLAYLVSYVSGRWRDAGGVSLPKNAFRPAGSYLAAVGCASDGYCSAAGAYDYSVTTDGTLTYPMVVTRS